MKGLITTWLALLVSATLVNAQGKAIEIKGKILNGLGKTVYLKTFVGNNQVALDSAILKKSGAFSMETKVGQPTFFTLSIEPDVYALLLLDSTNSSNAILFSADANDFLYSHTIQGSPESAAMSEFSKKMVYNSEAKTTLNKAFYSSSNISERTKLKNSIDSIDRNTITTRNEFIEKNKESVGVIIALSYISLPGDIELLRKMEQGLAKKYSSTEYYISLKTQLTQLETQQKMQAEADQRKKEFEARTAIGAMAPELGSQFITPTGGTITLESLRGNYVLIDFWASWCGPCRKENPNVVKLYNKYKDAGFTVYSVSLDKVKQSWEAAIVQDGLIWPNHVSDLKQWQTEATQIYGFNGIPYTVLLDKDGKIMEKNLRGPYLEEKLKTIFGY
jgi:thiol-disulfide isomerase/thioredoxin